jgi:C-terminal processing protease CtpA/Prc/Ca2+-binding EF-hand superfamily protein
MLSKPLIPSISRYLKTLNPTVQRALTKCALAQPDDPALWLANFFLRASPASDNYSLRKNNSVYLTHKDGAGVSTPPASSQTAALTAGDTTAIANATRASEGIHKQPFLKPMGVWAKRLRVESGKVQETGCQIEPAVREASMMAKVSARDVECQAEVRTKVRACQTTLTSRDALARLQKEAKQWVERRQRDKTENYAMHAWYEKIHSQTKLISSLRKLFLRLDVRNARTLRAKEIFSAISRDEKIQESLSNAPEALRALGKPSTWKETFEDIDRGKKGFITFSDWEMFVQANDDTGCHAGIDRFALLRALSWDEDVLSAIKQCPKLKPLLKPKMFEKTFSTINASGSGVMTFPELQAFVTVAREEEVLQNEEENRLRNAEKARLDLSLARDKVSNIMDVLKTLFTAMDKRSRGFLYKNDILMGTLQNSEVRSLLKATVALKPLLRPSSWHSTFRKADSDGDGRLNFGEWVNFCISATVAEESPYESVNAPNPIVMAMFEGAAAGAKASAAATLNAETYAIDTERKAGDERANKLARKTAEEAVIAAAPPPWRLNLALANAGCIKIQALVRGVMVRDRPLPVIIEEAKQKRAWEDIKYTEAAKIQALWRGYAVRTGIVSDMEDLLHYVLTESALKIQRLWRSFCLRGLLSLGKKSRTDIWVVIKDFTARSDDELSVKRKDVLFVFNRLEDPLVQEDGSVVGWFRATHYFSEEGPSLSHTKWKVIPSDTVRRTSKSERANITLGKMPEWVKMYDPGSVKYYYFNNFTGESCWERPENYVDPPKSTVLARVNMTPEMRATLCIQNAYRAKIGRRVARADYAMKNKARHVGGWVEGKDQRLKCPFWYNVKTHPEGEVLWEKPGPVVEHERKLRLQQEAAALRDENITAIFGDGPIGIEFIARKGNRGVIIKNIKRDSPAHKCEKLKRGLVLYQCTGEVMTRKSLEEVLGVLSTCKRPMRLVFTTLAKQRVTEKNILAASKVSSMISVEFEAGPMGLELAPRKKGGSIVKMIQEQSPAAEIKELRKGMHLMFVEDNDVSTSDFSTIMRTIRILPRPLVLHFKTAPSRALNQKLVDERVHRSQHMPPKHLREKKVAPKQIVVTFGPGPLGIELISRRQGGVLVKSITPGGAADQVPGLRKAMVIVSIGGKSVMESDLENVMRLLRTAPRPMTVEFFSMSHINTRTEVRKARKNVLTTFGEGPLGVEMAQIKAGGTMIKDIHPGGLCYGNSKLRKSMKLLKIDDKDVSRASLPVVIELMKRVIRPVEMEWMSAPSRKMNQQFKFERTGQVNLSIVFEEDGPLGIELIQRKRGGCMIKKVHNGGLAAKNGGLRKSMTLLKINGKDVDSAPLVEVARLLKTSSRPLKLLWKSAPSRSLSPHARVHSRATRAERERVRNLEHMRREDEQQQMSASEKWRKEFDIHRKRFVDLQSLIDDGSITVSEAVKMAKEGISTEDQISGEEVKVEKFAEENVEAALSVIKKYILKGKQYHEVLAKVPDLEAKITDAIKAKGFGDREIEETLKRIKKVQIFDGKKLNKIALKKGFKQQQKK